MNYDGGPSSGSPWVKPRHRLVFAVLRPLLGLWMRVKFNFHPIVYRSGLEGQACLILSNHNSAFDPILLAQSFRQPIYFVASDHIFRWGLISRVIQYLAAPIPIVKAQIDLRTIRQMRQVQQEGGTIGLFPSGNSSFVGPEMPIPPATGKLVKQFRMPVLLYRFEGGYLTQPRWARYARRGRLTGQVVRQLSVDEIAGLDPQALNDLIYRELNSDPYAFWLDNPAEGAVKPRPIFHGRALAEHLERVLFVCPACHQLNTLVSRDDRLFCDCGYAVRVLADGIFLPDSPVAATLRNQPAHPKAHDQFQRQHLLSWLSDPEVIEQHRHTPFFQDEDETVFQVSRAHRSQPLVTGTLQLFSDRLVCRGSAMERAFPITGIGQQSVHGAQVLQFQSLPNDQICEIISSKPRSAYRYMILIELLKARHKTANRNSSSEKGN